MDTRIVSPKIEIISHFDSLIHQVDVDIEECLEKYNEEQVIGDLSFYKSFKKNEIKTKRVIFTSGSIELCESSMDESFEIKQPGLEEEKKLEKMLGKRQDNKTTENSEELEYSKIYKTVDLWSESTKVVDYLSQIRQRTIDELRKAQEEALTIYKSQKIDLKNQEKFYFQVRFTQSKRQEWIFKLFSFVTDFYMSPDDISLLEKFINAEEYTIYKSTTGMYVSDSTIISNEKVILIALLIKHFFENLNSEKFPSHVISVRKKNLTSIKQIYFYDNQSGVNLTDLSIDLSNLEYINISQLSTKLNGRITLDGLSSLRSLRLTLDSLECLSVRNLPSLKHLQLSLNSTIQSKLLDYFPTIEYLALNGVLTNFNLDSLVNLKIILLTGKIADEFNFDLFKNICYQLEEIWIGSNYIDDECISKLFYGHHFPNLKSLSILFSRYITKLEKKLLDRFPMLQYLNISMSKQLREIDYNAFSNLKQLISLDLYRNEITYLDKRHFSGLEKLKYLCLRGNQFESIEENVFSNLKNLRYLDLCYNNLKKLSANSFAGLRNLKFLDLRKNNLKNLDIYILNTIENLEVIDLSENNISNKEEISNRLTALNIKFFI